MWARRFARASARWLLTGWVIAWSMLVTQPCCYAGVISLPAGHGQSAPHEAEWGHAHQSPKDDTEHDGCDEVVSGALTAVATDSTSGVGADAPMLPLSSPAHVMPVPGKARSVSFPVPHSSTPPPLRRALYLETARLRI